MQNPTHSIHAQPASGWAKSAFTLVEMLVVIAIISILMTAGSIGLSGMGGKGVTSGVATAESLFDEARTTAVSRNIRSCVLVARALTNNSADDLKRILVAYEDVDANGLPVKLPTQDPNWTLSSRGAVLPDQVYYSEVGSGTSVPTITDSRVTGVKTNLRGSYYMYEFNSQGIPKTVGAKFIIGSGARTTSKPSTTQKPHLTASAKRDFGGFVIWRNGRTSIFRSPEQMGSVSSLVAGNEF